MASIQTPISERKNKILFIVIIRKFSELLKLCLKQRRWNNDRGHKKLLRKSYEIKLIWPKLAQSDKIYGLARVSLKAGQY